MIGLIVAAVIGLVVGLVVGLGAAPWLRRRVAPTTAVSPTVADHAGAPMVVLVEDPNTAAADLAELRKTWQKRRHDVRGALSPALLTADRLTSHDEEQVRRAGQIVVQSLQRAIDALADPVSNPDV